MFGGTFLGNFEAKFGTLCPPLYILNWDCVFLGHWSHFFFFGCKFWSKAWNFVCPFLCIELRFVYSLDIGGLFCCNFKAKFVTFVSTLCLLSWGCVFLVGAARWRFSVVEGLILVGCFDGVWG